MYKIDKLGRVLIPSAFRKQLEIERGDDINMICFRNSIVISNPKKENSTISQDEIDELIKALLSNQNLK